MAVVVGIVLLLGGVGWVVASETGMLGPDDGLDCPTTERGIGTTEFDPAAGPGSAHASSPDEEIQQSDLWSFYDIPKSAWHLVQGDDAPDDGIVRVEPLVNTRVDRAEYLVYVNGRVSCASQLSRLATDTS